MSKEKKINPPFKLSTSVYGTSRASRLEMRKGNKLSAFFYSVAVLFRRAAAGREVEELQNLSNLIEAEIQALQKNKIRLKDVFRRK